jgi:hypothetical protein
MPNWCNNTAEIYHTDPAMLERVREAFNKGALLEEFIPVPASLKIIAGSVSDPVEQAKLVEDTKRNQETHGYGNWYDFCVNEWGTKWDIGADGQPAQDIEGGLILSFDSAWAPPVSAYEKLEDLGFRIRATYYEPGMAFAGIWENGSDDYYEYGGWSADEIAETLPADLDEAYCISESVAEWEAEQAEEDQE